MVPMVPQASRKRLDHGWVEDGRRTFWRCWELYSNFWYLHEWSPWNFSQSYFTYFYYNCWIWLETCYLLPELWCKFVLLINVREHRGIPHALVSTQLTLSWESQRNISFGGPIKSRILGKMFSEAHVFDQQKFDSALKLFSFPTWSSMGMACIKRPTCPKKQNKQVNHQTKWPYQHTNPTEKNRWMTRAAFCANMSYHEQCFGLSQNL